MIFNETINREKPVRIIRKHTSSASLESREGLDCFNIQGGFTKRGEATTQRGQHLLPQRSEQINSELSPPPRLIGNEIFE
jgi:hypothetical protein